MSGGWYVLVELSVKPLLNFKRMVNCSQHCCQALYCRPGRCMRCRQAMCPERQLWGQRGDGVSSCVRALFGTGTFRSILDSGLGVTTKRTGRLLTVAPLRHGSMSESRLLHVLCTCGLLLLCFRIAKADWQPYDAEILLDLFYMENYVSYFSSRCVLGWTNNLLVSICDAILELPGPEV